MARAQHRHAVLATLVAFLLSTIAIVPAAANNTAQTLPFSQTWSDVNLITDANWNNVPGIEGYFGRDITTTTGTDPQTLLTESAVVPDIGVVANQQDVAITNGGVAEFHLTDSVIALQGSATADAPYVLMHLVTTGLGNITVSYNLRDIDSTADNAVQPVALQYRVGSSGTFTNIPSAFVADATTGPSLATLVTPISALLPADANNKALVQVRVMTTNASGSDEWVGVDDISVTGSPVDPEPTPTPSPTPTATPEVSPTPTPTPEPSPTPTPTPAGPADITVSQVYGGGGNFGAVYTHDFIELFNRSDASVSLANMSLQYASATGTGNFGANSGQLTELPAVTLEPGEYFIVQEAGATDPQGIPLPPVDHVDPTPINMSGTSGKVALVTGQTSLGCNGGSTPCSPDQRARIVDLVGYGAANFFEGSAAAPLLSNSTAALRDGDGAVDTNDNAADFSAGTPSPHAASDADPFVASSFPSNNAIGVPTWTTLTVTFSEPVTLADGWYDLTCSSSGTHVATVGGGSSAKTIDPSGLFSGGETCVLTISAEHVTDVDTNDPPDAMDADVAIAFTVAADLVCGADATLISDIQGTGLASPLSGSTVELEGVVTATYLGTSKFRGFYVQEEFADDDGDPSSSEGVFVFEANGGLQDIAAGDVVRVRGRVTEFTTSGVTLTEIDRLTNVDTCGNGGSVPVTDVDLPFASTTFAERYEGMLVEFADDLGEDDDMVVTETFNFGRFGELVLTTGERLWTPTHLVDPGPAAEALQLENNLDRIVLDDGLNDQNVDPTVYPTGGLSASNTIRVGDTMEGGTFVLEQRFGQYRVQPTADLPTFASTNPRPPTSPDVGGDLRVAAMNVLNYFTTFDTIRGSNNGPDICGPLANLECRGANSEFEFQRQRTKVIEAILGLDSSIVGLMEIENNDHESTEDLVNGLNAATAPGTWAYVDTGTLGTDAIKLAIIYRPADVSLVGDFAVLDSSVDPRFDISRNRPALAQTFDAADGGRFTIVVNHLKSKGSGCGAGDDDTSIGGAGNCNLTRTNAAEALVDWIATDPTGSGDRDVLVIGDLNSYAKEAPIDVFVDAGYTDTLAATLGSDAYSFVFQGQSGYLDHGLASPTLAGQVTGAAEWHINADEPPVLDYNDDFKSANHVTTLYAPTPYRSSDHDPVIVGLDLLEFGFDGFLPPVSDDDTAVVNAGSALPMKWTLDAASGLSVLFGGPRSQEVDCATGEALGAWEPTGAVTGLMYNPVTGVYTYDWKTNKSWADSCRMFEVTFDDGSYWTATVHFIK